ncbi:hypothetical protein RJ639_023358 [Escallonia herrerae]|uniref:Uncharacterized protein n=1 Tax=Escallonia herrerae TaxID=1293975 RepID=A0AA88V1Y2_9ASTE|nr:hypothetical protein RJ639_023624 [Escallonia herrerae]KAK3000141.1 hypothetical protein RJ639_023358 [Escallonia herrerae]
MAKKGKGGGRGGGGGCGGGRGGGGQNAGVSTGGNGVGRGPPDIDAPSSSSGISGQLNKVTLLDKLTHNRRGVLEQEKKSAINGDFGTLNKLLEILLMSQKYKDLEDLFARRIEEAKEKQSQLEQKVSAAEREFFDLENLAKQQQEDETTKSEGEERRSLIAELVEVEDTATTVKRCHEESAREIREKMRGIGTKDDDGILRYLRAQLACIDDTMEFVQGLQSIDDKLQSVIDKMDQTCEGKEGNNDRSALTKGYTRGFKHVTADMEVTSTKLKESVGVVLNDLNTYGLEVVDKTEFLNLWLDAIEREAKKLDSDPPTCTVA